MTQHATTLPFTLSNPLRVISPLATAGIGTLMFLPPLLLTDWSGDFTPQVGLGVSVLTIAILLFIRAGWNAPFAMRVDIDGLYVRRLMRERRYGFDEVTAWRFAVPNAPPVREALVTNGVLYVSFRDRTRFRAEVTAAESALLVGLLPTPP